MTPLDNSYTAHQIDVVRYSAGEAKKVDAFLLDLIDYLETRIAKEGDSIASKKRLQILLDDVKKRMSGELVKFTDEFISEIDPFVKSELAFNDKVFSAFSSPVTPTLEQALSAINNNPLLLNDSAVDFGAYTRGWQQKEIDRIAGVISNGYYSGMTTQQIARDVIGTKSARYADGTLNLTKANAYSMAKTAVMHMSSQTKARFFEANDDIVVGEEVVATLDSRTSTYCFVGETLVSPVGSLSCAFKRRYDGDIVIITTSSGKQLKSTPNHPILTARGWTPANEIKPGADVVYSVSPNIIDVESAVDVCVPSRISALFDALSKPSIGTTFIESSSEAQFHGDGMVSEYEVNIAKANRDLNVAGIPSLKHDVSKQGFSLIDYGVFLFCLRHSGFSVAGQRLGDMTSKLYSASVDEVIKPLLATPESRDYGVRLNSAHVEFNGKLGITPLEHLTPAEMRHDAFALEDGCNCGGSGGVVPGNGSSGLPISVFEDDVVSLRREFFSGHVYNLHTDTELYIADGIIVHNCKWADGKKYYYRDGKFPRPPYHNSCRSQTAPLLSEEYAFATEGGTRPAVSGGKAERVSAETTYYEWLKAQPLSTVQSALGKTQADIFLNSGLSPAEFKAASTTQLGKPLTLKEMAARNDEIAAFLRNE